METEIKTSVIISVLSTSLPALCRRSTEAPSTSETYNKSTHVPIFQMQQTLYGNGQLSYAFPINGSISSF